MKANELAFFGKIAAGVTHELKNVLAIINESNGLMGDFLSIVKDSPFPYREKFQRSIGKIDEQIRRGVEITTRFNRFAHSMDHPVATIDLNLILAQTVALAERFARLRNIELRANLSEQPVMLSGNPFRIQMALTRSFEACMGYMSGGGAILLQVIGNLERPGFHVFLKGQSGEKVVKENVVSCSEWIEFEELVSVMDLSYEWQAEGGGFALFFPGAGSAEKAAPSRK